MVLADIYLNIILGFKVFKSRFQFWVKHYIFSNIFLNFFVIPIGILWNINIFSTQKYSFQQYYPDKSR